jgi:hypothetical protein
MKYQKRRYWKYRVYDDETYATGIELENAISTEYIKLAANGILTAKMGYVWDGASGPTIDTKNTMTPSLIHDCLYQLMRANLLDRKWRKRADEVLYEALRERGMWKVRAKIWYRAVRKAASKSSKYDVLTAP